MRCRFRNGVAADHVAHRGDGGGDRPPLPESSITLGLKLPILRSLAYCAQCGRAIAVDAGQAPHPAHAADRGWRRTLDRHRRRLIEALVALVTDAENLADDVLIAVATVAVGPRATELDFQRGEERRAVEAGKGRALRRASASGEYLWDRWR